jgi:hypothetical protein
MNVSEARKLKTLKAGNRLNPITLPDAALTQFQRDSRGARAG